VDVQCLPTSHRPRQDSLEVISCPLTEDIRYDLTDPPCHREDRSMFLIVGLQHSTEPRVPPRDVIQRPSLLIPPQNLPILPQLSIAIPRDEPGSRIPSQCTPNQTRFRQNPLPLRNLPFRKRDLKILTHLLQ